MSGYLLLQQQWHAYTGRRKQLLELKPPSWQEGVAELDQQIAALEQKLEGFKKAKALPATVTPRDYRLFHMRPQQQCGALIRRD